MKVNKAIKAYKVGQIIGRIIAHSLFIGAVWLITYGFLSLASFVFCFGVSFRSATASAALLLMVHYANYFLGKGKKNV